MTSYQKNSSDFLQNLGLISAAFILFTAAFFFYVRSEKAIDIANEKRLTSHELADELRQSSDNLTHMIRSYVITGNEKYKRRYQNILDIRNGKKSRPLDYHDTYEEQPPANADEPRLSDNAVPLLDLIKKSGVTHSEMEHLHSALAQSDLLSVTEYEAMRLIETRPLSEESRTKAIQILFDESYDKAKSSIMHSIYQYNQLMEMSTAHSVREAEQLALTLRIIFIFTGLILFIALWRAYRDQLVVYRELEQYKEAVENTFIVSKTDKRGIITYVNDIFCDISGYSRDELVGKTHNIIRHPDMNKETFKELWGDISHKKIWRGTIKNLKKDGSSYFVKSTIIPMLNEKGHIVEYLGLREDVSEIENARLKAEEADQIKTNFMANMSHEIRTPMNGILGFTHLLSQSPLSPDQYRYLSIINNSTETLIRIVNDILDFSKIEEGKLEVEPVTINPYTELNETIAPFVPKAREKKIHFMMNLDNRLHQCLETDIRHLKKILTNLIHNALKFTPEEGEIRIDIDVVNDTAEQQVIKFTVTDTGIGIPKKKLGTIFDKFSQADISATRQFGGTGLGLSIAHTLVSLMGGVLSVESEEGKGSRFYFQITAEKCPPVPADLYAGSLTNDPYLIMPGQYDTAITDAAEALNLDKAVIARLFEKFILSTSEEIQKLNTAIQNSDYDAIYQCALKLDGASSALRLTAIHNCAKEIEHHALKKDTDYRYDGVTKTIAEHLSALNKTLSQELK